MPKEKKLLVAAIKHGTVIDHIIPGAAIQLINVLCLSPLNKIVTIGLNLPSQLMGRKDLIKIEDKELTPEESNIVAIFSPRATINIIKNYETVKKINVDMPEKLERLLVCPNPKCITNNEPMDTYFYIKSHSKGLKFQCKYCEKIFKRE